MSLFDTSADGLTTVNPFAVLTPTEARRLQADAVRTVRFGNAVVHTAFIEGAVARGERDNKDIVLLMEREDDNSDDGAKPASFYERVAFSELSDVLARHILECYTALCNRRINCTDFERLMCAAEAFIDADEDRASSKRKRGTGKSLGELRRGLQGAAERSAPF